MGSGEEPPCWPTISDVAPTATCRDWSSRVPTPHPAVVARLGPDLAQPPCATTCSRTHTFAKQPPLRPSTPPPCVLPVLPHAAAPSWTTASTQAEDPHDEVPRARESSHLRWRRRELGKGGRSAASRDLSSGAARAGLWFVIIWNDDHWIYEPRLFDPYRL